MKRLLPVLLLLLLTVSASAQNLRWGVRAGITDGEPMIGGEFLMPIGAGFVLNPNLEFSSELFSANADVHYDFDINPTTQFWVGAGLAFVNPDEGDYDGGFNLLAGAGTRRGRWYPYVQGKLTSAGDIDDYGSIAIGVRF
ncbi:MAG TPA: hypothetical protein VEK11_00805 [Thermoanaerobaculia bacterium]|nr:hypothetical protein [Thermoanaerobaculia bacterium]